MRDLINPMRYAWNTVLKNSRSDQRSAFHYNNVKKKCKISRFAAHINV